MWVLPLVVNMVVLELEGMVEVLEVNMEQDSVLESEEHMVVSMEALMVDLDLVDTEISLVLSTEVLQEVL